jgi:hypothetical protein
VEVTGGVKLFLGTIGARRNSTTKGGASFLISRPFSPAHPERKKKL